MDLKRMLGTGTIRGDRRRRWATALLSFGLAILLHMVGIGGVWLALVSHWAAQAQEAALPAQAGSADQLLAQGRSLYDTGQYAPAIEQWQAARSAYQAQDNADGVSRTQIYEAQALESLGQTRRACNTLLQALTLPRNDCATLRESDLENRAFDTKTQITGLRLLGESLQLVGQPKTAQAVLQKSIDAAGDRPEFKSEVSNARLAIANAQAVELTTADLSDVRRTLSGLEIYQNEPIKPLAPQALIGDLNRTELRGLRYVQTLDDLIQTYQTLASEGFSLASLPKTQAQVNAIHLSLQGVEVLLDALAQLQTTAEPLSYDQLLRTEFFGRQGGILQQSERWIAQVAEVLSGLSNDLGALKGDRPALYTRINLAQSLILDLQLRRRYPLNTHTFAPLLTTNQLITWLETTQTLAEAIGDPQAQAYALGSLGELYTVMGDASRAEQSTRSALALSQSGGTTDLSYRWAWRLGKLAAQKGRRSEALGAYSVAVQNLNELRADLVATNRNIQFSFRDNVEPVYREYIDLLLPANASPDQKDLVAARDTIERLQLAEIDDYFREPCARAKSSLDTIVEKTGQKTAIIYPIILPDRLELILKLPNQTPLIKVTENAPQASVESAIKTAIETVNLLDSSSKNAFSDASKYLYTSLIKPIQNNLKMAQIETLVFVPDSRLGSFPLAALLNADDGRYLVQDYSIAISPGMKLPELNPKAQAAGLLAAGISEKVNEYPELPYVKDEIEHLKTLLPGDFFLNQTFTQERLQQEVRDRSFPIIHLATHGQFGSTPENTFLLTWGGDRINVNDLSNLLRNSDNRESTPLELLVLSACQTAVGDRRAALGIAGATFRSGARTVMATLWNVNDKSTNETIKTFYDNLLKGKQSKAKALQQAQIRLITEGNSVFQWAPFVLVGDWS